MPGNQLLQMGLFVNKILIPFLFFLKKTPPFLLCTPSSSLPHATELWKHPGTFPPWRLFRWGPGQGIAGPASRYLPNGAVLPIGELGPAAQSKEWDKVLVAPQHWLFQSSSVLWVGALAGPGVLQMCLLPPHCPSPPLASPLQSYIILHIAAAVFPVFLIPLTRSLVPSNIPMLSMSPT